MSAVRDAVTQSMQRRGLTQYARQAEPVIGDLEAGQAQMADRLIDAAIGLGASRDQARNVLIDVGLLDRPAPAQAAAAAGDNEVPAWARGLVEFARRNGYTG